MGREFETIDVKVGIEVGDKGGLTLVADYILPEENSPVPHYQYRAEALDENLFPELEGLAVDLFEKAFHPVFSEFGHLPPLREKQLRYLKRRWYTMVGVTSNPTPRFDKQIQ